MLDHYPLLFHFDGLSSKVHSIFRFFHAWTLHPDCNRVVEDAWKTKVVGCPIFILANKLQILKKILKDWNYSIFENVHEQVKGGEGFGGSSRED